ncbi:MAG: hypothetical protein R3E79_46370 [Caldilineaceae bacterium]
MTPSSGGNTSIGCREANQHSTRGGQPQSDSKIRIAERLLTQWVERHPERQLPVTFDSWYTTPGFCHYLNQQLKLPYVGTLTEDVLIQLKTGRRKSVTLPNTSRANIKRR